MAYELAHSADFRRQLKAARYARLADTAITEQAEEREAARKAQEQEQAERATRARANGSVAAGRRSYDERHPTKTEQEQPAQPHPLDTGLDPARERINDTERTGQRGMKAGRDRFKNKTVRGAAQGTYDVEGVDDGE